MSQFYQYFTSNCFPIICQQKIQIQTISIEKSSSKYFSKMFAKSTPVGIFTNILRATFLTIFFNQNKIQTQTVNMEKILRKYFSKMSVKSIPGNKGKQRSVLYGDLLLVLPSSNKWGATNIMSDGLYRKLL